MGCAWHMMSERHDIFSYARSYVFNILQLGKGESVLVFYTEDLEDVASYFKVTRNALTLKVSRNGEEPLTPDHESISELERLLETGKPGAAVTLIGTLPNDVEVDYRIAVLNMITSTGIHDGHGPGLDYNVLAGPFKQNFAEMKRITKSFVSKVGQEGVIGYEIKSNSGTNIFVPREGGWCNEYELKKRDGKGEIANIPPGEVYMEKGEGGRMQRINAEGKIVMDLTASNTYEYFPDKVAKIELELEKGFVTSAEAYRGNRPAPDIIKKVESMIKGEFDSGSVFLQELGVGLLNYRNLDREFYEKGKVLVLEKLGIHFGLGLENTHWDGVLIPERTQMCVVYEDGKKELVYDKGKLLLGQS